MENKKDRITVVVEHELLEALMETTRIKSKSEAFVLAAEDFVRREKRKKLLDMPGKIRISEDFRKSRKREIEKAKRSRAG